LSAATVEHEPTCRAVRYSSAEVMPDKRQGSSLLKGVSGPSR
jgi:hypothetical protein